MTTLHRLLWYRDFHRLYGCHPLEGGLGRLKHRRDRRYGMKLENPLSFYARFWASEMRNISSMVWTYRRMKKMLDAIWHDPAAASYTDIAITAPGADELSLGIYQTRGTAEAIEKLKRQDEIKSLARAKAAHRETLPLQAAE
jgi:hypothetical protein